MYVCNHYQSLPVLIPFQLILLIGNYMNGTGVKGGAFGFRVSSINKLVDTKSLHNTTLLHFLERTVSKHFPDMEHFLDELAAPAEAYRGQHFSRILTSIAQTFVQQSTCLMFARA